MTTANLCIRIWIVTTLLCHFCLSEVDARHTSGLFIIQGELEDLSRGGRIFKNRGHERVMRSLVMDGIAESIPRLQLVLDPAPFLAFQSYWERTIRLGWTQLLSWNSPLLHMTTVVILWYAIMQHRNVYISLQVSQKNLWSRTCINTVYQALSPIFRVPGNKAKCTLQWSVKVTSSSAWQFCIGSLLPEGCC